MSSSQSAALLRLFAVLVEIVESHQVGALDGMEGSEGGLLAA